MSKWITIEPASISTSKSGLTRIWSVINTRTQEVCGCIRWHGAYRKYVFDPASDFIFDSACLTLISLHLERVNAGHRKRI